MTRKNGLRLKFPLSTTWPRTRVFHPPATYIPHQVYLQRAFEALSGSSRLLDFPVLLLGSCPSARGSITACCSSVLVFPLVVNQQAVEEGPRATEQFTAIAAAFVAGLAAVLKSQELAATFMGRAAPALQSALAAEDSLACNNLASLLAHLFCCGVVQVSFIPLTLWGQANSGTACPRGCRFQYRGDTVAAFD